MLAAKTKKPILKGKGRNDSLFQKKSKAATSPPTTVELRGVQIHFPFKPYQCQEAYMAKVLDALNNSENALLESPTGTGKTLCLLCSTLAWQQEQTRMVSEESMGYAAVTDDTNAKIDQTKPTKSRISTIIYASRTHSQLSQVVKELRFTRYRPRHAVLGSREQMCVHPKVKTAKATSFDINHNCTRLNKDRKCRYRNNLDGFVVDTCGGDGSKNSKDSSFEFGMQPVLDMEELIDLGKKRKVCPFYLTRGQITDANLIFVPYNYLFDKDARSNTLSEVQWENAIIIFDEAHNLESFASESASFDLSSVDIAGCVNEVTRAIGYLQAMPEMGEASNVKMDNLIRLKSIFLQLEQYIDNQIAAPGGSFTGDYIFEIFAQGANLNHSNHAIFLKFIKQVSDMVMDVRGGGAVGSNSTRSSSVACPKLDHFVGCVKRIFGTSTEGQCLAKARAYRVHISAKPGKAGGRSASSGGGFVSTSRSNAANNPGRVLSYWCFAPSLAMHELAALNVRSILVTSGTLSPLPSYSLELGIPFPHTLENAHIIGKDQISVRVIGKGVSGKSLTSTYNRRENIEYVIELANTIISLARVIPGGILIFFPSYGVMETCIEKWGGPLSSRSRNQSYGKNNFFEAKQKRTNASSGNGRHCFPHSVISHQHSGKATPWQRLLSIKAIVLEPKVTSELKDVINEFDKYISAPKSAGCIMMGVCRGKISEGIDFADEKCRAVIITGIPFAPYLDPKVKLKREYLDSAKVALMAKPSGDGGFDARVGKENKVATSGPLGLSGADWYSQQAHRAVNQAIGRVIRHSADYGAILFLDSRFSEQRNQQGISKWIRPCFETDNGVGGAIQSLAKFFRGAKAKSAAKETAEQGKLHARGLKLKYEEDPVPLPAAVNSGEKITKIAFIKKVQGSAVSSNTLSDNNELLEGYVPPDRIIKQVQLDDEYISKVKTNSSSTNDVTLPEKSDMKTRGLASLYKPSRNAPMRRVSTTNGTLISETLDSAWSELGRKGATSIERVSRRKVITKQAPKDFKRIDDAKEKQKRLAQQFFKMAKENLNSTDFGLVRKLLVALKASGAKKDKVKYIGTATELVDLLLKYHESHLSDQSIGEILVGLLHFLLPKIYRFDVQKIACDLRLKMSVFGELSTELMSKDNLQFVNTRFPNLMIDYDQWNDGSEAKSIDQSKVSDLRTIISIVVENRLATNKEFVVSMKSLLPRKMRNMTTMLINELRTKQNMKKLKDNDCKRYGEEGINKLLFQQKCGRSHGQPKEPVESLTKEEMLSKIGSLSRAHEKNRDLSEKIRSGNAASIARVDALKLQNPYLSKKSHARISDSTLTSASGSVKRLKSTVNMAKTPNKPVAIDNQEQTPKGLDPLERYLQQAKAEIYRKATPKVVRINRQLKSHAPDGTVCNICGKTANSFFMAECNHFSCLDCWVSWLKRSPTCPTCRNPTSKKNLYRVVFEREAGAGAPSLTQMIGENYESSDDDAELEIVTHAGKRN